MVGGYIDQDAFRCKAQPTSHYLFNPISYSSIMYNIL